MADISVTASAVTKNANAVVAQGTAGATIAAGQTLYKDTTDLDADGKAKLKLADADASATTALVEGIALHAAVAGQPISYIHGGDFTMNAALTAGKVYVQSSTAGGIAPVADLTTNWRTSILGFARSTTVFAVSIVNTGVAN